MDNRPSSPNDKYSTEKIAFRVSRFGYHFRCRQFALQAIFAPFGTQVVFKIGLRFSFLITVVHNLNTTYYCSPQLEARSATEKAGCVNKYLQVGPNSHRQDSRLHKSARRMSQRHSHNSIRPCQKLKFLMMTPGNSAHCKGHWLKTTVAERTCY